MLRGKGRTRRLRDGQCVHIGANRRGMRGARASVEESTNTAGAGMGHFTGKRSEHALDIGYGLRKIEIELRNAMQVATIATKFLELGHKGSFHGAYPFTQYCDTGLWHTCFQHIAAFFKRYIRILLFGKVQRGRVFTT